MAVTTEILIAVGTAMESSAEFGAGSQAIGWPAANRTSLFVIRTMIGERGAGGTLSGSAGVSDNFAASEENAESPAVTAPRPKADALRNPRLDDLCFDLLKQAYRPDQMRRSAGTGIYTQATATRSSCGLPNDSGNGHVRFSRWFPPMPASKKANRASSHPSFARLGTMNPRKRHTSVSKTPASYPSHRSCHSFYSCGCA